MYGTKHADLVSAALFMCWPSRQVSYKALRTDYGKKTIQRSASQSSLSLPPLFDTFTTLFIVLLIIHFAVNVLLVLSLSFIS